MATNYTGNSAPTLSNAPASSWTDDAAKHSHVGNTYLVTGSGSDAGKVYSFEEYPTPLVKSASGLPKPIVTITDGGDNLNMVHAQLTLSPIQSLNGYDHPWAGGAGKNKYPDCAISGNGDVSITQNGSKYTLLGTPSAYTQCISTETLTLAAGTYTLSEGGWKFGVYIQLRSLDGQTTYASTSGSASNTFTLSASTTLKSRIIVNANTATNVTISIQIELGSTATEWTPYENLCPITGHTQATINRTGENLLGITVTDRVENGITITQLADGGIKVNGTALGNVQVNIPATTYAPSKLYAGQPYTLSGSLGRPISESYLQLIYTDEVTGKVVSFVISETPLTYTPTHDCSYNSTYMNVLNGKTFNNEVFYPMLNIGSTAKPFVPYSGASFTLSLGQTVYGGKIDLVTGEGEITLASVDLGTLNYFYQSANLRFVSTTEVTNMKYASSSGTPFNGVCSALPVVSADDTIGLNTAEYGVANGTGDTQLRIRYKGLTDAAAFKTAMSGVQLVYELATPIPLSLSGQQIQTLLGENIVWGDGEVSRLVYRSNQFTPAWQWFETWTMPKITRDNGQVIVLPYPQEYTPEIYDVDAATTGRNAAGTMIRDRVARKHKFNYKFPPLSQADATEILDAVQDVSFTLTTASPETGAKANYRVYVGDRSLPVYWMQNHNNASWLYSSLSLNLIEM